MEHVRKAILALQHDIEKLEEGKISIDELIESKKEQVRDLEEFDASHNQLAEAEQNNA